MCGIAGFLGGYGAEVGRAMSGRISHRGPDDQGFFFDEAAGISLVHRRLAIIDLSPAGRQPMTDKSARYTICYNGEVYNSPDLRRELESRGVNFRGHSDTEVIVELYAREGIRCLQRLNGIFAFAIWDQVERTLLLVRDGMGVKPLYITRTGNGLAFSSEMKGLLSLPGVSRDIDHVAAAAYLTYLWSPGERTMLSGIRKLPPGSWLRVSRSGREKAGSFYSLPDPQPIVANSEELVAGTLSALRTAVRRQVLADVDVGAFLSGGLDSSAIVALAREFTPGRMQCFTIDYRATGDELAELIPDLPYARRAAAHLGVDLHEVAVDASMAGDLERMVYHLDEPQADPAALNTLYISELARSQGIKVLLSGAGADDLLTGYRRHSAAALERYWTLIPQGARATIAGAAQSLPAGIGLSRRVRKLLAPIGGTQNQRISSYFEWLKAEDAAALLTNSTSDLAAAVRAPFEASLRRNEKWSPIERMLRLDQEFFLTDHNLNYTDKMGMAAGVEVRVPFLDPDFVAWAASVPPRGKMRHRKTKWVLRKAMEPLLPSEIIFRPKTGFGVPLRAWLKGGLRPLAEELLSPQVVEARGLFRPASTQRLKDDTFAGRVDASYTLFGMMAIELWMRRFVDARNFRGAF